MRYSKQEFRGILGQGGEYLLTVGFTVGESYRTPEHRQRLLTFFEAFGTVVLDPSPLDHVPVFDVCIPGGVKARELTDRLYEPSAADVLESLATVDAGDAFIYACSSSIPNSRCA